MFAQEFDHNPKGLVAGHTRRKTGTKPGTLSPVSPFVGMPPVRPVTCYLSYFPVRPSLLTFACFAMFSVLAAAQMKSSAHPKIVIEWPEEIASERVSIDYFMTGPFGGYGLLAGVKPDEKTYMIDAAVEDVPAVSVKVIAWIRGCEIVTLTIPVQEETTRRKVDCKPVASIRLRGKLLPNDAPTDKPQEVTVYYIAGWSHTFFGIFDGMLTNFRVGTVSPDPDGGFEIALPDLAGQPGMEDADFQFTLLQAGGNVPVFLRPVENSSGRRDLKVLHEYPAVVQFAAQLPKLKTP